MLRFLAFTLGTLAVVPWPGREPIHYCVDSSVERYRPLVETAFWRWKSLVRLEAAETKDCGGSRTIAYRLWALDPPATGFAFGPPPKFGDPWAGDVFVSSRIGDRQADLMLWALLHETGHAFGMGESEEVEGVMCPRPSYPLPTVPSLRERRAVACAYEGICY